MQFIGIFFSLLRDGILDEHEAEVPADPVRRQLEVKGTPQPDVLRDTRSNRLDILDISPIRLKYREYNNERKVLGSVNEDFFTCKII